TPSFSFYNITKSRTQNISQTILIQLSSRGTGYFLQNQWQDIGGYFGGNSWRQAQFLNIVAVQFTEYGLESWIGSYTCTCIEHRKQPFDIPAFDFVSNTLLQRLFRSVDGVCRFAFVQAKLIFDSRNQFWR